MTRETKIGLLVGLAFIIVIGILLSDHMTSTNAPQQALLSDAAPNVRESVTAPAPSQPTTPPVSAVQITPANRVPTQAELQPPPAPPAQPRVIEQVRIGGPTGGTPPIAGGPIVIESSGPVVLDEPRQPQPHAQHQQPQPQPMTDVVPMGELATAPPPAEDTDAATAQLEQWAGGAGRQVAAPRNDRTPRAPAPQAQPQAQPQPAAAAGREYVAQPGDNLARLAARMLGANTKANRDAIVKANPSLQRNPNLVVEGRKYKAPGAAAAQAPAAPTGTAAIPETVPVISRRTSAPIPVTELVEPLPASTPADRGEWYVVKENDNLWRIATEQLGSGNAAAQIKELNKDVLKGGDNLVPNMRLRLPARRVANAAN